MTKIIPLAILASALAACSGSSSLNCPASTQSSGVFTLTLNLQHTSDECVLTSQADGGPPPADASIVPGTQTQDSLLCSNVTDAGPTVYMVVANSNVVRSSTLDSDGGFTIAPPPTGYSGSVVQALKKNPPDGGCLCTMPCAEHYTLSGTLKR
jgi:hypothetical protein